MSSDMSDIEMETSDVVVAPTKRATKKAPAKGAKKSAPKANKKAATKKAPKVKAPKEERKLSTLVPSEHEKRFTPNAIVSFLNTYFSDNYKFVQFKEPKAKKAGKMNVSQNIIDLSSVEAINRFRTAIEANTENKPVATLTYNPYMRSVLDFYAEHPKAEGFEELCVDFGIKASDGVNVADVLDCMLKLLRDNARVPRTFNAVFGEFYAKKYQDQKDVHKRYLQRSPELMADILEKKNSEFDVSANKLDAEFTKAYCKRLSKDALALNKRLAAQAIEKVFNKDSDNLFRGKNVAQLKKAPEFEGAKVEDIEALLKMYNELVVMHSFNLYISEIDDEAFYHEKFDAMNEIINTYDATASVIEKLKSSIRKNNEFSVLVKALVHITRLHIPLCGKNKKPFMVALNALQRYGVKLNIKRNDFKSAINELAAKKHDDAACDELAGRSEHVREQLATPKNYNPLNDEIYNKMGTYIYHNWGYEEPIAAMNVRRPTKVAVGMQLLMTVKEELHHIKLSKKTTKIVIKF